MTTKIVLEPYIRKPPIHPGAPAQRYQVWLGSEVLIQDTHNPEYEACRALLARGITGRLETFRPDKPYPCMILDIEKAAGFTISETKKQGPSLVRWKEYPKLVTYWGTYDDLTYINVISPLELKPLEANQEGLKAVVRYYENRALGASD